MADEAGLSRFQGGRMGTALITAVTMCLVLGTTSPSLSSAPPPTASCIDILQSLNYWTQFVAHLRTADIRGAVRVAREYFEGDEKRARRAIQDFFRHGAYHCVIQYTNDYVRDFGLREDNFEILLYKAIAQQKLEMTGSAIETFESAVPFLRELDNVQQGRFAFLFFQLGKLHYENGSLSQAADHLRYGLVLAPQQVYYQILLGEVYEQLGERETARAHYDEVLESPHLTEEERAVIEIKAADLPGFHRTWPVPTGFGELMVQEKISLKIQPINGYDPAVDLDAICLLLLSKLRLRCEVLPPVELAETAFLDEDRDQYDGDRVLQELQSPHPPGTIRTYILLGITGHDIYGGESNFVFSWQNRNNAIGVVSSYRFIEPLDDFYEKRIVATRRLGIQFLSTAGSLLGFDRESKPHCPMAYPDGLEAFLQKGSKLCRSTIEQRDRLLSRIPGGVVHAIEPETAARIETVYTTYYFRSDQ